MQPSRHRRVAVVAGLAVLLALAACPGGGSAGASKGKAAPKNKAAARGGAPSAAEAALDEGDELADRARRSRPAAPPVTVTWEALAVEREQAESSRFRRSGR